jgi:hypothetical protein
MDGSFLNNVLELTQLSGVSPYDGSFLNNVLSLELT